MQFFYLLLLVTLSLSGFAQSKLITSNNGSGLVGLLNSATYELIVPHIFTNIQEATDGTFLGIIHSDRQEHVYFDKNGKAFLYMEQASYSPFSEGLARFHDGKAFGYINTKGETIIQPMYENATHFHEGVAIVQTVENKNISLINPKGVVITNLENKYTVVSAFSEGLAYAIKNGEIINEGVGSELDFPDGIIGSVQYIDKQGKVVIDLSAHKFVRQATPFKQGLAVVGKPYTPAQEGEAIDTVLVPDMCGVAFGTVATKYSDEVYGVIDRTGKFVLPPRYKKIDIEPTGTLLATCTSGAQMLFDKAGKPLITAYYRISPLFGGHFRLVQQDSATGNWGVIDVTNQNKLIVPTQYAEIFYNAPSDFWAIEKWQDIENPTDQTPDLYNFAKEASLTIYTYSRAAKFENKLFRVYHTYTPALDYNQTIREVKPFEFNGKWGIINNFEIKAVGYDSIAPFEDATPSDLIGMQKRNKWGHINSSGEVIVPPTYTEIMPFKNNYAIVQKGTKWGLIGKNNKSITAFEFDGFEQTYDINFTESYKPLPNFYSTEYIDLLKATKKDLVGLINTKTGKMVLPFEFQSLNHVENNIFIAEKAGKYGIINLDNKELLPCQYDDISTIKLGYKVKKGNLVGLLDSNFKQILPTEFEDIKDGYKDNVYILKNNKMGIANNKGEILLQPEYEEITNSNKHIQVKKEGKKGLLTHELTVFIPCEYDNITYYIDSFTPERPFTAFQKNKLTGVFDEKGKEIIPPLYEEIDLYDSRDNIVAKKAGKYGVIDLQHKIIINFDYDLIEKVYTESEMYIRLTKNNKQGVGSKTGELLLPVIYDEIGQFTLASKLLMGVKKKDTWGYINAKNKMVIPNIYEDARAFQNVSDKQYAIVKKQGKWGVIDHKNKVIIPFEYTEIYLPKTLTNNITVQKNERFYEIDFQGREVKK